MTCQKLAPTWERLAQSLEGSVRVAKIDAEQSKALANRFGVRGYPTLLLFSQGETVPYEGGRELEQLKSWALENKNLANPGK
jgi:thioredoxin-like negative regulator of GroEL